jgi:homoserine kinase
MGHLSNLTRMKVCQEFLNAVDEIGLYSDEQAFPCPLKLKMINEIPLARGLGSSASAIVCGMLLANVLCGYNLSKDELLDFLLELEGTYF